MGPATSAARASRAARLPRLPLRAEGRIDAVADDCRGGLAGGARCVLLRSDRSTACAIGFSRDLDHLLTRRGATRLPI